MIKATGTFSSFSTDDLAAAKRLRDEGMQIAWFQDPAGNFLSLIQDAGARP